MSRRDFSYEGVSYSDVTIAKVKWRPIKVHFTLESVQSTIVFVDDPTCDRDTTVYFDREINCSWLNDYVMHLAEALYWDPTGTFPFGKVLQKKVCVHFITHRCRSLPILGNETVSFVYTNFISRERGTNSNVKTGLKFKWLVITTVNWLFSVRWVRVVQRIKTTFVSIRHSSARSVFFNITWWNFICFFSSQVKSICS